MPAFFDTGFCVRQPSWHQQELLLADYPGSWDEARMAAGLMWEPYTIDLFRQTVDPATGIPTGGYELAKGARQVARDDTHEIIAPRVSDDFELLGNGAMGEIVEAVLEQDNVKWETAGSVKGGSMVWVLVRLDEPYTVDGDKLDDGEQVETFPYLTILNSHDGTGACKILFTQVRVVCWNTIQAADADGDRHGRQFSFRHTSGLNARIEDAQTALRGARDDAAQWQRMASELFSYKFEQDQTETFIEQFLPTPPTGTASDRVIANVLADRDRFRSMLDSPTNSGQAGTGLGLVNCAVEWLDHARGFRSTDTYMGRQLFRPEPLKTKAVHLVRELATTSA
jgi:phage/plasmid-like protein (TIGR03299 family)